MKIINVARLKNSSMTSALAEGLEIKLADLHLAGSVEDDWECFRDVVHSSALKMLGLLLKSSMTGLIKIMRRCRHCMLKCIIFIMSIRTTYHQLSRKTPLPPLKPLTLSEDLSLRSYLLLGIDGTTLIIQKTQILQRWDKYFVTINNQSSSINDQAVDRIPYINISSATDDPLKKMKLWKVSASNPMVKFHGQMSYLQRYTVSGTIFIQEGQSTSMQQLPRNFSALHCLARVLLNCLVTHQELDLLLESEYGFLRSCKTIDMTSVIHQLVDVIKAFNNVSQQGLWSIKSKFCYPTKFIQMVHKFHNGMMARVLAFPVTNGVKHDFVLAPTVLSMLSAMLNDAFQ
ncbi:hypothetical protein E2320_010989, partial [Naja naja]